MGVVLDSETESEREGKMKGSTYGKTVCASFFFFKRQMPACES